MATYGQGYDGLLHLAALNNNVSASLDAFLEVNLELTKAVLQTARDTGIARFVYVSTVQAWDRHNHSPYATSKRLASEQVAAAGDIETRVIYLAAVVGDQLTGKLAVLGEVPQFLRKPLLQLYSAMTPVTDIADVTDACWEALSSSTVARQQIVVRDQSENIVFVATKRCIDLIAALVILIPFIWLLAIIWLAVRLQSPGPGIFAQERIGKNGQAFTCYKFRTMAEGSPNVGTHEVSATLVTPIGAFLRRSKLDELPQAFNILLNEMSLVGPRPCLPNQDAVIAQRQKLGVLSIKPGITGLAQIERIDMSQPSLLARWDADYVKLRSLRLDLSILIKTALGRGNGDAMTARR
jgi:lipopolysaccharide/colanic/teichoic acid biosynthesis glycosyltransferase